MIFRTPFFLPLLYPGLIWRVPAKEKVIYLTFDDGPVSGPTELVLDTLQQSGIKATFFCIGDNVKKNPAVFQRIVNEGHAVANHTFNHLKGWTTPTGQYIENIQACQVVLTQQSSAMNPHLTTCFRPPYGRITRQQIKELNDYRIIMWDVLTHDYDKRVSPERCLKGSIRATRPGSIVVFHDSLKAERNMSYVLPRYISHFSNEGFTFGRLPAC